MSFEFPLECGKAVHRSNPIGELIPYSWSCNPERTVSSRLKIKKEVRVADTLTKNEGKREGTCCLRSSLMYVGARL